MVKSIEYCLDRILEELEKNWLKTPSEPLRGEELLKEFGLPLKHEYFKGLIDKLIDEKFVEFKKGLDEVNSKSKIDLEYYEKNAIITVKGYYFIKSELGYTQREIARTSLEQTVRENEKSIRRLTIWMAVGTVGLLILEIAKWICERCNLGACHCP